MARIIAVLIIVAIACLTCMSLVSQPLTGVVEGVCVDSKTGVPIDEATVDIDLNQPDVADDHDWGVQANSGTPDIFTNVPTGWTQGTQSDSDLDLAGHEIKNKTHWEIETDSTGHFLFHAITVGSYTVTATSTGHVNNGAPLAVVEGSNIPITMKMDRTEDSLTFDTPGKYWTDDEYPTLGLRGLLTDPKVDFILERLSVAKAITVCPKALIQDESNVDTSALPGEVIRRWTDSIDDADDEGSFYDQIQCFSPASGKPKDGLYRLSAYGADDHSIESGYTFVVTDLAVVAKTYNSSVLIHAANLRTGLSVSGMTAVCLIGTDGPSHTISSAITDVSGLCTLSCKKVTSESQAMVLLRKGDEVAGAEVNPNSPGTVDASGGEPTSITPDQRDLRAFIYTDRTVYKPGNLVHMKGISRWFVPGSGFVVPSKTKVEIDVTDAQNTKVDKQFVTTNSFGSWTADFTLSPETLTGEYTVQETVEGQSQSGTFDVASYTKPEYQATVTFDKQRYIKGDKIVATVTGSYYFGAPLSGGTCSIEVHEKASAIGEDDDDPSDSGTFVISKNTVLNGNGQATIVIDTNAEPQGDIDSAGESDSTHRDNTTSTSNDDSSGSQSTYSVSTNVGEGDTTINAIGSAIVAQGDFSIAATASSTVAKIGDKVIITASTTDQNGAPLAGKELKVDASYDVWENNQDTNKSFSSGSVTTNKNGTADYVIQPVKAGLIDVQFSGDDARGNHVSEDTQIWVPDKDSDIPAQYSDIAVQIDRQKYQPGDIAHVLVTTSHPGPDALVTIEGTTLYHSFVVPLVRRATQFDIPVASAYAPGVTVEVSCFVDKQMLSSSADLVIDDPRRALRITVQPDRPKYHPDDQSTVKIHTTDQVGRPVSAEISVAVVDSAIFAIDPGSTDTISDAFLPEQSNDVVTSESTDTVYYGDVDKGSTDIDIRKKFPDTALWIPDLVTDHNGNASFELSLPETLTTWRVTAYGQTKDTAVGESTGQMVVNKDLTVRLNPPAFLTNGDQSQMVAMVNNNTDKNLYVHFHLLPAGLKVSGDLSQQFEVNPGSPVTLTWPISSSTTGTYLPEATVQAGPLTDGVQATLSSYPHGAMNVVWSAGTTTNLATESVNCDANAIKSDTTLTIRLTPTLASALTPAAEYLSSYPYGSTDSTVSALIADSVLYRNSSDLNLASDVTADIKQKAQRCLLRTYAEQKDSGGWGWFSTDAEDDWMTAYAAYGMIVAQDAGLTINPTIEQAALSETDSLSTAEIGKRHYYEINASAVALSAYDLAQTGSFKSAEADLRYLERVWKADPEVQETSVVALAARAELAVGTPSSIAEANRLMSQLWKVARETGAMLSWTDEYHSSAETAGQYLPDANATAEALLAAEEITPQDPRIDEAARWLAANRNDDHWCGVDATGTTVEALTKYIGNTNELKPNMSIVVTLNGKQVGVERFAVNSIGSPETVITIPGNQLQTGANLIDFSKSGTGRLYYSIKLEQTLGVGTVQPPPSLIVAAFDRLLNPDTPPPPSASGFTLRRIYTRMTSRRNFLWEDTVPTPDWQYNKNDSILVRLIIDAKRPGSRIVINEPVPPGCKIAETSGEYDEDWSNWWDYTDVRESDIVFFVNDLTPGEQEIDYHLIAQRPGDYDVMPTSITSMVDPTLQAVGVATKVHINGN